MITTLHTFSLASITHHKNSPRVQLRHPPRAPPQLTRPPLLGRRWPPRCCAARRARRSCASPLARPSSQHAPDHHPPPVAWRASRRKRGRSSPGCRSSATAHRTAGHERNARRACGSVAHRERGRSSPGRRCPPQCCVVRRASPLVRPSSQRAARPSPVPRCERASRRERGRCSATARRSARRRPRAQRPTRVRLRRPRASAAAAHPGAAARSGVAPPARPRSALPDHRPPPTARHASRDERDARRERGRNSPCRRCSATARRAAGHERDVRRRCQSRETVAVLRPSVVIDGEKDIYANRNFLPCLLCKTAREKNFLMV